MTHHHEINRLDAELQMVQDEINRRHGRIDAGVDRARNLQKIDELRARKIAIQEQLMVFAH